MKHYNAYSLVTPAVLLFLVLAPTMGYALDLTVEPRIQTGIMDYQYERKALTRDIEGVGLSTDHGYKIVDTMPFIGGGVTLFLNRFFVDFYIQQAFSASDSATDPLEYHDLGVTVDLIIDSDFDHNESSISLGYALGNHWALFGGYRRSKTNFNEDVTMAKNINDRRLSGSGKRDTSFKQDGYFIGSAFAVSFREHAVITFNTAVAILDGKHNSRGDIDLVVTDTSNNETISSEKIFIGDDFNGDTVGLNLGVSWKGRIGESLSYTLGANGYAYDFNAKGKDVADLSESVLRFSAGLSYQF